MRYLLDTCVISEYSRPQPDGNVMAWFASVSPNDIYVPAVVFGELREGAEELADGTRKDALRRWIGECHARFADRIVAFDYECADLWGRIFAERRVLGKTPPILDSQIAATARRHGMMLVTRNTSDMAGLGVELLNPFARKPL